MASTYTTKLGLAKPAHGDVNWHIPINENWDKIDTELDKALKISGTTIDANKNWNGKNITNVGQLQANSVTTTIYTLIPDPCIWYQDNALKETESTSFIVVKTAKAVPACFSGTVSVHYDVNAMSSNNGVYAELRKNGSVIRSHFQPTVTIGEYIENVAVTPGDVISLALRATGGQDSAINNQFEIRAVPVLAGLPVSPPW